MTNVWYHKDDREYMMFAEAAYRKRIRRCNKPPSVRSCQQLLKKLTLWARNKQWDKCERYPQWYYKDLLNQIETKVVEQVEYEWQQKAVFLLLRDGCVPRRREEFAALIEEEFSNLFEIFQSALERYFALRAFHKLCLALQKQPQRVLDMSREDSSQHRTPPVAYTHMDHVARAMEQAEEERESMIPHVPPPPVVTVEEASTPMPAPLSLQKPREEEKKVYEFTQLELNFDDDS